MPEDRRLTIGSTSRLGPEDVARRTFATSRRGFEPTEVRAFLAEVARDLQAASAREHELLDLVAAAEQRASNPVLDEGTLTTALGQETARVLKTAHDAAAELLAKAEAECTRLRALAQQESEQLGARTEQHASERVTQADAAAAEVRRRAEDEASTRLESSKLEAEALVSQARAECRAMVQEAQDLRTRVLTDLTRRRRVLHTQIEQLRAGRERLAETISGVRHTVDRVTDDLFRAEDEARLAAEVAGRNAASEDDADADSAVAEALSAANATSSPNTSRPSTSRPSTSRPSTSRPSTSRPSTSRTQTGEVVPAPTPPPTEAVPMAVPLEDEGTRQQAVEELFARLRAEQAPSTATGVTVLVASSRGQQEPDGQAGSPGSPIEEDPVVIYRNELLDPLAAGLARRIKRAMQDDQNDILDRLRASGSWSAQVLPAQEEHEQRYVRAAVAHLDDAARAGAAFAGKSQNDAPPVGAIAAELASAIVTPLRLRLGGEGAHGQLDDEAALVEHVGAAFREWKGQRVERVATDHAVAAFSTAVIAVTPKDEQLRWVVDDNGAECPDCDDNALAGAVGSGEVFPTGHVHPPAHSGCRCLLAPGNA